MKYCEKCFEIINEGETCSKCGSALGECKAQSKVKVAKVKGNIRALVEPALMEKGVPFQLYNTEQDVYNQYNPKINAETEYTLLVPFEFYNEAFDICVGLGLADVEEKIEIDESTQAEVEDKTYDQRFEEATGTKRKTFQILWIVLFIVVACLLIWGIDLIAALIKGNVYDLPFSEFL